MWGVGIASEKKMRHEAAEIVGTNLEAELVPLSFAHKDGGEVIKEAPIAYIPHLWEKVKDLLDQNSDDSKGYAYIQTSCMKITCTVHCGNDILNRVHRVTWHNGGIPSDEVWLKLGGDKGGGTVKLCFQHLNVSSPNAPENTCVFSIFEGPDSYTNLSIGLGRYIEAINDLQGQCWRYISAYMTSRALDMLIIIISEVRG